MQSRADGVWCGAQFSPCGRYRYRLTREWGAGGTVVFILLNPSTADATRDDPTIRRCMGFASRWGFGGLAVVNLFAWRATRPADLRRAGAPAGPRNAWVLWATVCAADRVVVAWGNEGGLHGAGAALLGRLERRVPQLPVTCLGWTRLGYPRHVLYLPSDAKPHSIALGKPIICNTKSPSGTRIDQIYPTP